MAGGGNKNGPKGRVWRCLGPFPPSLTTKTATGITTTNITLYDDGKGLEKQVHFFPILFSSYYINVYLTSK